MLPNSSISHSLGIGAAPGTTYPCSHVSKYVRRAKSEGERLEKNVLREREMAFSSIRAQLTTVDAPPKVRRLSYPEAVATAKVEDEPSLLYVYCAK